MEEGYNKLFVALTGGIWAFCAKVYALDIIEPDTLTQALEMFEAFIDEVKQDFSSGLIGGSAALCVYYVKKGLSYAFQRLKAFVKARSRRKRQESL